MEWSNHRLSLAASVGDRWIEVCESKPTGKVFPPDGRDLVRHVLRQPFPIKPSYETSEYTVHVCNSEALTLISTCNFMHLPEFNTGIISNIVPLLRVLYLYIAVVATCCAAR